MTTHHSQPCLPVGRPTTHNQSAFLAYIPIIHQGYLQFFAKYPEIQLLYLLDGSLTQEFRDLQKDLRALSAEQIKTTTEALYLFQDVQIVTRENITAVAARDIQWVMPAEEVNEQLAHDFFQGKKIIYDSIFLRWDRKKSMNHSEVEPDVEISRQEFDQRVMRQVEQVASKSSDWWRQTGAALVRDGNVLIAERNRHVPQDTQHYSDGDPRANFSSGVNIDIATSLHAEGAVIASAAKQGIPTAGADLYCTTFPCPYCSPLIAAAGIKTLYYSGGYSLVDGAEMMKSKGVRIVKVVHR